MSIEIVPVEIKKEIEHNDDVTQLIISSLKTKIQDRDIFVITQKIISKQEGRMIQLDAVIPSILSLGIGAEYKKDPRLVEVILSETQRIVRMENQILIVETKHGFVCANAGVDESNVKDGYVTILPIDSDKSAMKIKKNIQTKTGKQVAVIISDTFGRPFRMGQTNGAIGIAGLQSIMNLQGTKDDFGKILRVTAMAISDEICSAADLVMGKTLRCPVAIVRNYHFEDSNDSVKTLARPEKEDLFR